MFHQVTYIYSSYSILSDRKSDNHLIEIINFIKVKQTKKNKKKINQNI